MSAVNATTQVLLASDAVKAIVADRVNPGIGPQGGKLPDIVVDRISGGPTYALTRSTAMTSSRIQVECRARSFTEAEKLGATVIKALQNYRGKIGDLRVTIQASGSDYSDHADDASVFRRMVDFYVWTTEAAAA